MNKKTIQKQLEILVDGSNVIARNYRDFFLSKLHKTELSTETEKLLSNATSQIQDMVNNVVIACKERHDIDLSGYCKGTTDVKKDVYMNECASQLWWSLKHCFVDEEKYEIMAVIKDVEKEVLKGADLSLVPEEDKKTYSYS